MWARFVRWIRSVFGGALDRAEDPELIIKQAIRDMRDKTPAMNQALAKMRGGLMMCERDYQRKKDEARSLKAKIKAALEAGDETLASEYAVRFKRVEKDQESAHKLYEKAKEAYEKQLAQVDAFKREQKKKIQAAQDALRAHQAAKWKSEVAEVFQTFEVGDIDQTLEEMTDKLAMQTAEAEGRLEFAADSVDMKEIAMERRAEEIEAKALLNEFKAEWGMEGSSESPTAEKTIGPAESETN